MNPSPRLRLVELQAAILPEVAAAVAKLMSNRDLVLASSRFRNVSRCRNTIGEAGTLAVPTPAQSSDG